MPITYERNEDLLRVFRIVDDFGCAIFSSFSVVWDRIYLVKRWDVVGRIVDISSCVELTDVDNVSVVLKKYLVKQC
jgi:hypothetical protein